MWSILMQFIGTRWMLCKVEIVLNFAMTMELRNNKLVHIVKLHQVGPIADIWLALSSLMKVLVLNHHWWPVAKFLPHWIMDNFLHVNMICNESASQQVVFEALILIYFHESIHRSIHQLLATHCNQSFFSQNTRDMMYHEYDSTYKSKSSVTMFLSKW